MNKTKRETILITGACGFLGSRLIPKLARECGDNRIVLVDKVRKSNMALSDGMEFVRADLKRTSAWEKLPRSITRVFYLAGALPYGIRYSKDPAIMSDNLLPIAHMVKESRTWRGLKQIIYSSTISVYGQSPYFLNERSAPDTTSRYGLAKLVAENLLLPLELKSIRIAVLRYSSLYGFGQNQSTVLPVMVRSAMKNKKISVHGSGKRTMDFLECEDAATANILAYIKNAGGVFNIGSGKPVTMNALASGVNKIFTEGGTKIVMASNKKSSGPGYKIDISAAKRALGYRPEFQLNAGLKKLKEEILKDQRNRYA